MTRRALVALLLLVAVAAATAGARAADTREYTYLFVQGRLSGHGRGEPIEGARVRLTGADGRTFEAPTNSRGVFEFTKLPLGSYDLDVRTANGKVIVTARRIDSANLDVTQLDLRVGEPARTETPPIVLRGDLTGIDVAVPRPRTRWAKLRNEILIFTGAAAVVLAL